MKYTHVMLWSALFALASCHSNDPEPATPDDTPRLLTVSTYTESASDGFALSSVTSYFYSESDPQRLKFEILSFYNKSTQQLFQSSTSSFTYNESGHVTQREFRIPNTDVLETINYQYRADGKLTSMHVTAEGPDADIAVTYEPGDTLQAFYQYSNGNTFTYRVSMKDGNPIYEKTLNDEGKKADESFNTFDDHINPYSLLGYTDYLFRNYSKNNQLTAVTTFYIGSQEAIPESFEYTYNDAGLPLSQIVNYKSNGGGGPRLRTKYTFQYD